MGETATFRFSIAIFAAFGMLAAGLPGHAARAQGTTEVHAKYGLYFNGLEVGRYTYKSSFNDTSYSSRSHAKLSALFGAFKWNGRITVDGSLKRDRHLPSAYKLSFKGNKKKGSITLEFGGGGINRIDLNPDKKPKPDAVPVTDAHLQDVYDPMTAIMAISQVSPDAPCRLKLPIFDGRKRFDLAFSYKGDEHAGEGRQAKNLVVCRVKYVPIAGHRQKDFDKPWVDYDRMEIALRYVPAAKIFVPYRVSIPTTLGSAEMHIGNVRINQPDRPEIALRP